MSDLGELLERFAPADEAEAADCARLRALAAAGDPWSRDAPCHVTASALVVHPPTRRVLLRWHAKADRWLHVGGHADPGETDPLSVVRREGREETGLTDLVLMPVGESPLVQVVVVPVGASPTEPAHEHADVRFVLATASPEDIVAEDGAPLRWLEVDDALAAVEDEANLVELVRRAAGLLSD